MILKIRTMVAGEPNWQIIGEIESIGYRRIDKKTRLSEKFHPDFYVMALDNKGKINESIVDFVYVYATQKGKVVTICSNMAIYLLNDDGKTIEKIS